MSSDVTVFNDVTVEHCRKVELYIHGYRLVRNGQRHAEQYVVYDQKGTQCAYIRLRHGVLRVDVPEGGHTIFSTERVNGDGWIFSDDERFEMLDKCIKKMIKWYLNS